MNNLDKKLYTALKFFANYPIKSIIRMIEQFVSTYHLSVPEAIEKHMILEGYISAENKHGYAITETGLDMLRKLENIKRSEQSILISIFALIIALITFIWQIFERWL